MSELIGAGPDPWSHEFERVPVGVSKVDATPGSPRNVTVPRHFGPVHATFDFDAASLEMIFPAVKVRFTNAESYMHLPAGVARWDRATQGFQSVLEIRLFG